jgi:hypothetical protein
MPLISAIMRQRLFNPMVGARAMGRKFVCGVGEVPSLARSSQRLRNRRYVDPL